MEKMKTEVVDHGETHVQSIDIDKIKFVGAAWNSCSCSDIWAEIWKQDVILPDGRTGIAYYNFESEDIVDEEMLPLNAEDYPWELALDRIILDD